MLGRSPKTLWIFSECLPNTLNFSRVFLKHSEFFRLFIALKECKKKHRKKSYIYMHTRRTKLRFLRYNTVYCAKAAFCCLQVELENKETMMVDFNKKILNVYLVGMSIWIDVVMVWFCNWNPCHSNIIL